MMRAWLGRAGRPLLLIALGLGALLLSIPANLLVPHPPPEAALTSWGAPETAPGDVLRFHYRLRVGPDQPDGLALYFISATPNSRLEVNGVALYERRQSGGPYRSARPITFMREVPAPVLHSGDNEVLLEVSGLFKPLTMAPLIYAGPEATLREWRAQAWLALEALPWVIMGGSLLLGGMLLALWTGRRQQRAHLLLAILLLLSSCKLLLLLSPMVSLSPPLLKLGAYVTLLQGGVMPACVAAFVGAAPKRWLKLPMLLAPLLLMVAMLTPDAVRVHYTLPLSTLFIFYCLAAYLIVLLPQEGRKGSFDGHLLLGLWLIFAVGIPVDVLYGSTRNGGLPSYSNHLQLMSPALLVFCALLVRQWRHSIIAQDESNRHLAQELRSAEMLLTETLGQHHAQQQQAMLLAERERLMRDLHDGVSNRLVSALALCSSGAEAVDELEASLRDTLTDLRLVLASLNDLDGDLAAGIAGFLPQLQRQAWPFGVTVECDVTELPDIPWLRPVHVQHVLRIMQEAVMNAARHSGAPTVRIEVPAGTKHILVRDRGRGTVEERPDGLGLRNMHSRARQIGGTLEIISDARGTTVSLALP